MIALCYQFPMAQALIRKLNDETLEDYRAEAKRNSRSLEAELRELIERNRPRQRLTPQEREELSNRLTANQPLQPDSGEYIREFRETLSSRWDD